MKTLKIIGMVPLVLVSATVLAQGDNHAVPRSGGGSSDAGSRHTGGSSSSSSSGGSSSSSSSSSGGGSSSGGSSYDSSTPSQDAARRRPRPGTGTGDRGRFDNNRGDRYSGSPYSYYYYDPFSYSYGYGSRSRYGLFGYGYGYGDYGYSYGDYYGYYPSSSYRSYRYRSGYIAQLRTLVEPVKTRVYVDGYYAGIADDFDGLLQRLNVSPGRHDITLKLEGFTTHTFAVYANRDQTIKLRWDMVRGNGETRDSIGEESDLRSERDADRDRDADRERDADRDRDAERERDADRDRDRARTSDRSREVDADSPADRRYVPPSRDPRAPGRGELLLDVEPADASVYVDGEFYGKAAQVTRIELAAGRHRIEVVRPGYKTEETEIDVEGEAKRVVFKLSKR